MGSSCLVQEAQLEWPVVPEMQGGACEGGPRGRRCVSTELSHVVVQQGLTQHCKATICQ